MELETKADRLLVRYSVFFPTSGFWSGNRLLFAPFPDLCLLVPFFQNEYVVKYITIAAK